MSLYKKILRFLSAQLLTQGSGALGALANTATAMIWYDTLVKPAFTPPSWVFAPVWITLYFLMGLTFFLVREASQSKNRTLFMQLFLLHLIPLTLWSLVFFGLQIIGLSVVIIATVWISALLLILLGARVYKVIPLLLLPYFLWVSYASIVNISLWLLNN